MANIETLQKGAPSYNFKKWEREETQACHHEYDRRFDFHIKISVPKSYRSSKNTVIKMSTFQMSQITQPHKLNHAVHLQLRQAAAGSQHETCDR